MEKKEPIAEQAIWEIHCPLGKQIKEFSKQQTSKKSKKKSVGIDVKTLEKDGLKAYKENRFTEWAKQHLPVKKQKKSKKA